METGQREAQMSIEAAATEVRRRVERLLAMIVGGEKDSLVGEANPGLNAALHRVKDELDGALNALAFLAKALEEATIIVSGKESRKE